MVVLGKGENESADDLKLRLSTQAEAKAPILPRSYGEPEKSFRARMDLSRQMDGSVPTFHAKVNYVCGSIHVPTCACVCLPSTTRWGREPHAHTCTHTHKSVRARTHARMHAHTYTH